MSNHSSQQQPIQLIDVKNDPEPGQSLLDRQPQDELIDFSQINGFLRENNNQLANSYAFAAQQQQIDQNDINFDQKEQEPNHQSNQHYHVQQAHQSHTNGNSNHVQQYNQHEQHNQLLPQASQPKAKARRRCICKKTQCLKMYCQCFASNMPCTEQCTCFSCKNTLEHQKEINQAKLMIQEKGIVGLHSCSLSEKRCNCKKSNCLKKYCECYNSGVKCSQACKCEACKNCDNPKNDLNENENQNTIKAAKNGKPKKQKKNTKVEVKN